MTRSAASLAFPLLIVLLVPLRRLLLPRVLGAAEVDSIDPPDWGRGAQAAAVAAEEAQEAQEEEAAAQAMAAHAVAGKEAATAAAADMVEA